jgi:hypothetical protein
MSDGHVYYLTLECENCDEEIVYGPCVTFIEHRGAAVIPVDSGAQARFDCEACGESTYTGDIEYFAEGEL